MSKEFEAVLTDYLNQEKTDYALMLNGAWGSGKTFYINNTLKQEVEKHNCPKNKNDKEGKEKYKLIYVTLYGLQSIDEFKDRIFFAINPKYRVIDFISRKALAVIQETPLDKMGKILKNLITILKNLITKEDIKESMTSPKNKVFFFDDLERIDIKSIDFQSVLGYINKLTEHDNYKIVVVANDDNLGDDYKQFKEKTIRFTYSFSPNTQEIYDNICDMYKEEEYKTFLKEQKELVLDVFSAGGCKNIRTLIFLTDIYKKIYQKINEDHSREINQDLLLALSIISIEAKRGISKEELKNKLDLLNQSYIPNYQTIKLLKLSQEDSNEEEYNNTEKETLKEKYEQFNETHTIRLYDELYDYVYNGYIYDNEIENIIKSIQSEYHKKEETEEVKLAKLIINWPQIPDNEFHDIVKKINKNVSESKYKVVDLLKIYGAYIQIEEMKLENFKIDDNLTIIFKTAIDKAMENIEYYEKFERIIPLWQDYNISDALDNNSYALKKYNYLRNYTLSINQSNKGKTLQHNTHKIIDMIKENDVDSITNLFDEYKITLIMAISPKELLYAASLANKEMKKILFEGFQKIFPYNLTNPPKEHIAYLDSIISELNNRFTTLTERKISDYYMLELHKYLKQVTENYKGCTNN